MRTFEELEEAFPELLVNADQKDGWQYGTLKLAGQNSEIRLIHNTTFVPETDENGWFQTELKADNGEKIILQDGLVTSTRRFLSSSNSTSTIFPNTIVLGADYISKKHTISEIQFRLDMLSNFFGYRAIDSFFLPNQKKRVTTLVEDLREMQKLSSRKHKLAPRKYDFNDPIEVFVAHNTGKHVIRFRCNDMVMSVWLSLSFSHGQGSISISTTPTFRIVFDKPTLVGSALTEMWRVKRFFEQVALQELAPTGIWCRHKSREPHRYADIYLPNSTARAKGVYGFGSFGSGNAPYSSWKQRFTLRNWMQRWLSVDQDRLQFRVFLGSIISSEGSDSISDIVTLCAAIDGLAELDRTKQSARLSSKEVRELARATQQRAEQLELDIDEHRIRNLLGMLGKRSLDNKLRAVIATGVPIASASDIDLLVSAVKKIRQIGAHGRSVSNETLATGHHVSSALASVCVLYDLVTTGLKPSDQDYLRSRPYQTFKMSLQELTISKVTR